MNSAASISPIPPIPIGSRRRPLRSKDIVLALISAPFVLLVVLPLIALIVQCTLDMLKFYCGDSDTIVVIGLSLGTSTASTLLVMMLTTPLAILLARRNFPGRNFVEAITELPVVLPPAVAGLALLLAFGRRGIVGSYFESFGIHIAFTTTAVVIAQTFVSAPFYLRAATAGLAQVNSEMEDAAASDGATFMQTLRYVTVPLCWRGILGGATMCWARAMGEFGATIIFAGNYPGRTQTMPLAVYLGFETDINRAITLAVILLMFSFAVLLFTRTLFSRERLD